METCVSRRTHNVGGWIVYSEGSTERVYIQSCRKSLSGHRPSPRAQCGYIAEHGNRIFLKNLFKKQDKIAEAGNEAVHNILLTELS
jgi:hypothetical protein